MLRHWPGPVLVLALITGCSSGANESTDGAGDGDTNVESTVESTTTEPVGDTQPAETSTTDTTTDTTTAPPPTTAGDPVGVATIVVEHGTHAPMAAAVTIELSDEAHVDVTAVSGDHEVVLPRTGDALATHEIAIAGFRSDRTYDITATPVADGEANPAGSATATFDVPPLPDWLPDHTITVGDASQVSPGITLVETGPPEAATDAPFSVVVGYDETGEIVWYYGNDGGLAGVEQTVNGTFLAHYWPFGIREFDVLGDVTGNWRPEIDRGDGEAAPDIFPTANAGDAAPVTVESDWLELRSFHHENWPMPNGNILALSTTLHELTPEQRASICPGDAFEFDAISDVAVEFEPDGTVVRTWDIWDAVDIVEIPGSGMCGEPGLFASDTARDWTHANSVVHDPERDAILISVRHTDQIIAFEYGEEDGPQTDVRWILGAGATIPLDGEPTFHQHAVEVLDDGEIVVYDNGNDRPGTAAGDPDNPPYSRAVIYRIDDASDDPGDWSAEQVWEHRINDPNGVPIYTSFIGDADVLANGNVLVTHGGIGELPPTEENPLHAVVIEVVRDGPDDGSVVWRLDTDPTEGFSVYRTERIESFATGPQWAAQN